MSSQNLDVAKDIPSDNWAFNLLKNVYNWLKGIYMTEDSNKVASYVTWLNRQTPGQIWVPLLGFNAITTCHYNNFRQLIYNPNFGTPLKSFINQVTGEVRSFDAKRFYV